MRIQEARAVCVAYSSMPFWWLNLYDGAGEGKVTYSKSRVVEAMGRTSVTF